MVGETSLSLSPFMLKLDHLVEINSQCGGFYFVQLIDGLIVYDFIPAVNRINGKKVKPIRYYLTPSVKDRLVNKTYKRWYYGDRDYLYPLKKETYQRLIDRFAFIETESDLFQETHVVFDPGEMFLRKKPLVAMREDVPPWYDKNIQEVHCAVPA